MAAQGDAATQLAGQRVLFDRLVRAGDERLHRALLVGLLEAVDERPALQSDPTVQAGDLGRGVDPDRLHADLEAASTSRDLIHISMEWLSGDSPEIRVSRLRAGRREESLVARYASHGEWIEWLAE